MKWKILDAEPTLDHYIEHYCSQMSSKVPVGLNCFDYGVDTVTQGIRMFQFSEAQNHAQRFIGSHMYKIQIQLALK